MGIELKVMPRIEDTEAIEYRRFKKPYHCFFDSLSLATCGTLPAAIRSRITTDVLTVDTRYDLN